MLVEEKKKTKILVSINNIDDIEKYKKVGISTFVFALKDYSIGYEKSFSYEEINNINETKYVLINQVLDNNKIDSIKNILPLIKADGFIFEDIGLINVFKELNINGKKILFMNHFNCNFESVNIWLDYVDSVFISNELTYEEIKEITMKCKKEVVLHVFGYNQIMYSKRKLLSNYYKYNNKEVKLKNTIKDKASDIKFNVIEDINGTIFLSNKIYDGRRLFDLDNVLYYYMNTSFISIDESLNFINDDNVDNTDNGFLDRKTIYKLKS